MTDEIKLAICVVGSVVFHVALKRGLDHLPPRHDPARDQKVTIQVVEPAPPAPPPEPPPEPEKPPEPTPEKIIPHESPAPHPVKAPQLAAVAKDSPPPDHPAVTTDTQDEPVFGVSMSSTSPTGTGPAIPVGNTTRAPANTGSAAPAKPLAQPVGAFEATKMPLPQGRCFGKYTDEARAAGDEGTVVLDLVVDETGRAREIHVTEGLPHGLTEAAIKALQDCRFTPGEKDGQAVPVKIRGFKIHFVLSEAQ
ncbi:MAG: TonB family protein [Deltaproteobacteria bacterium]|nr:TonB family protein [Deltaproteobacteria bacterium]